MIAHAVTAPASDLQQEFLSVIAPRVTRYARLRALAARRDNRQEIVAESMAVAWRLFLRLHEQGRGHQTLSKSFVHYSVLHALSDRHFGGKSSCRCVMSRKTQRALGTVVESINSQSVLNDRTLIDRKATPAELACLRIDFKEWHGALPPRQQQMVDLLMTGERPSDVAEQVGLSRARISELRGVWRRQWEAHAVA